MDDFPGPPNDGRFRRRGPLLIRVPPPDPAGQAGGNRSLSSRSLSAASRFRPSRSAASNPGLAGFDLVRAADTIAAHGHAEFAVDLGNVHMPWATSCHAVSHPVWTSRRRLVLRDAAAVDGLSAGCVSRVRAVAETG